VEFVESLSVWELVWLVAGQTFLRQTATQKLLLPAGTVLAARL
jgi:hypothetical protein